MNVLSIDTTAEFCSIALRCGDKTYSFHESRPREHAKITLPETESLLKQAGIAASDLNRVVFGRGPGSFTGVRIATGIAQGLGFAAGCKLIPLSTLQSLAYSLHKPAGTEIWSAIDARMSEIYFARFIVDEQGVPVVQGDEQVLPPADLPVPDSKSIAFVGNGWKTDYGFCESIQQRVGDLDCQPLLPNALDSLHLATLLLESERVDEVQPEQALPTYLRDKVAWDNKPKVGS